MSAEVNQEVAAPEQKPNDKEFNFRQLEAKYERIVAQERQEREKIARELEEIRKQSAPKIEEDDDSDPYVDHKKLAKRFASFERQLEEKIERKAEEKARSLLDNEKKNAWMGSNPDFYDILQHADKLAESHPDIAESILRMPDGFERQKLVYSTVKSLGLHKPKTPEPSIQDKINANRRTPYYQPSGIANAPYQGGGDFSPAGQKSAYEQMKALQKQMRLG